MKKAAKLYRMHTEKHICPYGLKSLDLLKRKGFEVEDHKLASREQTDTFKHEHNVKTTPQTFIQGRIVGGFDDLQDYFGVKRPDKNKKTYTPIVAVFSVTLGLALAISWLMKNSIQPLLVLELFVAISMSVLAVLKLRDLNSFSNQFITYDLLAMRWIRYSYLYPFVEAFAGLSMVAKFGLVIFAPLSFAVGLIGTASVVKAVYIDKRDLKCACVGGNSNVPLGFVSLTENIMMVAMGLWMTSTLL